ncbi:MAG: hypothetical protein PHC53_03625 [Patescibacteria group bacterium]|nr:hypothetical protein [Patescibacteria group bacterium]
MCTARTAIMNKYQGEEESKVGKDVTAADFENISQLYEEQLELPSAKPTKQILLCPVGLVGSGKTTVVKPLSKALSLLRISTDEIRKILKENGFNYVRTREIAKNLIGKYLKLGHGVAIDADCAGSSYELINEISQNPQIKVIWIHINPPESFILNKLRNYKHTWLFKNADDAIYCYQERKPLHEHLDMPFLYTFDTSRDDLDKQIEEAIKLIQTI